ncbi:hypothetical protein AU490_02660 [Lonsdalea populi]|uniref:Glycoside hydrolase family 32 protein n=1 Tax=Lonsdalea populi TaxID=1172565 RepID=A0A3N0USW1_9GAMM|nr:MULTISPECIES: glycoside hydrolase family 32 protein [Lonsdalea]RAT16253.1 hypothetical protein AU486_08245 [Lonsdalea quercina]RAT30487.1 hypothetical protein AU490_02660 [Lonsdalea populi]RAT34150.1 hypothetical protein AU491_09570 [Lonsdalea populi]RAT43040.1 hypothetical protein AU496_13055 [Lonsdalea populi]RAT55845.1 hypothetical protein AU497_01025 [Lonsdalea populi]
MSEVIEQRVFSNGFHLSSKEPGFMNDIQTFIYDSDNALWHGYYLWNGDYVWGGNGTEWRHFTTSDWVKFEDHGVAIPKYKTPQGDIATGSVVIDQGNLVGYGEGAWLAYVTSYIDGLQTTNLWYSDDKGYTFSPCESNPVQPNNLRLDNYRDPFAFIQNGWVYIYLAEGDKIGIYRSRTGKAPFTYVDSVIIKDMGLIECPTLLDIRCGDLGYNKSVLVFGANGGTLGTTGTFIHVGTLDYDTMVFGNIETPAPVVIDNGPDFYGARAGYDETISHDRLYCLGWASNWGYWQDKEAQPIIDKSSNIGIASLMRKLKLRYVNDEYYIENKPVFSFSDEIVSEITETLDSGDTALPLVIDGRGYIGFDFQSSTASEIKIEVGGTDWNFVVTYTPAIRECNILRRSRKAVGIVEFEKPHTFTLSKDITWMNMFIDYGVIELFFSSGESCTFVTFSSAGDAQVNIVSM